jgi:hypothetical protein
MFNLKVKENYYDLISVPVNKVYRVFIAIISLA